MTGWLLPVARLIKIVLVSIIIALVLLVVISRFLPAVGHRTQNSYSTVLDEVKANRLDSLPPARMTG